MKKFIKILLGAVIVNLLFVNVLQADEVFGNSKLETSSLASSQSVLEKSNESFSTYEGIMTYSSQSSTALSKSNLTYGWNTPEDPGSGGWTSTDNNPVGASISDTTLPILLSMFFIYFLYRGVSSKKRKSI